MTCKYIELHDSDNEPILINPSWIACIEKNEDESCSVINQVLLKTKL